MMQRAVSVECTFAADGAVRVRRIELGGQWYAVEQGRQWRDEAGRHVLIMVLGKGVGELLLATQALQWVLLTTDSGDAGVA